MAPSINSWSLCIHLYWTFQNVRVIFKKLGLITPNLELMRALIDGWVYGWIVGWMDSWTDRQTDKTDR